MAVLRPARRDSINYNPNKGDNAPNVKRMNSFSAFTNGHRNTYEIPTLQPLPRRHYSSAGYSTSPCGSFDTKSNSQQSRICNIRYRQVPPPTLIPQIHCYNERRNGPYITEISPDPPSKVPSISHRPRQRNPCSTDTTPLDPSSLDSNNSKALVPSKAINLETSSRLTVTAELAPPPSSRQRRITGDTISVSINTNDVYNALKESAAVVAIQTRKSESRSQHRQVQEEDRRDKGVQRRESLVSMIPRAPISNVTTASRVAKGGRKSSSGSEAGRSFDETTVQQSVKFYSTSAQCYIGDSAKSHSSRDDGGEIETMSVKGSRELRQMEVTSIQSSSKATIGILTRKQSITRSIDSFQSESRFPPVVVSAIPKLSYKNRERSDESKELLVSRSFETAEARSTRGSGSTTRKSTVSSSNSKHSSKHTSKHHERCRRPSTSIKPRERR